MPAATRCFWPRGAIWRAIPSACVVLDLIMKVWAGRGRGASRVGRRFCAAGRRPIGRTRLRGERLRKTTPLALQEISAACDGSFMTREDAQYG